MDDYLKIAITLYFLFKIRFPSFEKLNEAKFISFFE